MSEPDAARLWLDAREIAGITERQAPARGRPIERDARLWQYRTAIEALRDAGWHEQRIGVRIVLQRLGRTGDHTQLSADVKDFGGWRAFRAKVYRGD
jgi:hypothetical protein